MALHLPAIVTLLALLLFVYSFLAVGMARKKYGVAAPATTGHAGFEVVYRVQMNTLEQLVLFLPALWLFSDYISPLWAGLLGFVWLAGRVLYAVSYIKDPKSRGPGFIISFLAVMLLIFGTAIGVVMRIMAGL
ncbi:MAPEG family protein [Rheinheimera sediminis]|uniref:MAPEG family protein n=1 Tax=Rheinheimera sp. YQF-1 TaxID=2499626 RepID=UPI000FDCC2ED|nr:MAPEG family protein [Rheinheimera sp. YQF-1]RVT47930.1 MAPEG family protein [Rheinheimera sp. YQF-1]